MTGTSSVDRYVRLALGVVPLAAAATLGLGATPVHAAEPATADQLVEVVVTARYREENLQSTPLAISAFSAEELEARSLVNVSDLGGTIPNAFIRQSASNFGPTQTIGLRGLIQGDFSYAFEPAVGIYIDDVYHGTLTGSTMDLLDLDRVEVLRGPQGTLFGINTMGGAVRLISKKPQGDGSGWIEATYGSRRRLDVKAMGDFSLIDNLLYARVSG
ncbi:MAG TPA: TonB-dependent receptor plug domain-containing protein, partial [Steroidobacteraceae bacterium]|nr:TonB-dependent receptor plug domain-containing protein [Steroidobacteraceae bacterium]